MGYRSDGLWVIKGPKDAIAAAFVAAAMNYLPPEQAGCGMNDFSTYTHGDVGYIRLEYEQWKWYASYPDIRWYESLWSFWSEQDGLSGARIRIGEDDNDIERDEFGDNPLYMYVNRSIECDEHLVGSPLFPQPTEASVEGG